MCNSIERQNECVQRNKLESGCRAPYFDYELKPKIMQL